MYIKLNPWRCSPEEPRPTEAVAVTWLYKGALWLAKCYTLTLISVFITGFHYFFIKKIATQLSSRGSVDLVRDPLGQGWPTQDTPRTT